MLTKIQMHKFDEVVIECKAGKYWHVSRRRRGSRIWRLRRREQLPEVRIGKRLPQRLPAMMFPQVRRGAVLRSCRMNRGTLNAPFRNVKEEWVKPIPQGSCPICDTLWREYAHATAEHVKLLMESQIAVIERDTARDETLEAAIADAGQKRESARTAIREHEAAAHEKKSS
jgi:hypothetical protein